MSEKRERLNPSARREQILAAALDMAIKQGYKSLNRDALAAYAGVAKGQIHHSFNTMTQLRRAVMRAAIHRELLPIIAQGVAQGDKDAHAAPDWLKRKALDSLMGSVDHE